jgi:hypothetical protein
MNEMQLLAIALSTVPTMVVVLIGILINNARLGDLRTDFIGRLGDLRTDVIDRISDTRDVLRAEMARDHNELLIKFSELDHRMDGMEHRMDGMETRLRRIEGTLGVKPDN